MPRFKKETMMKRITLIIAAVLITVTASAEVGRYKNINVFYPGYTLRLDTATGELTAVHYDNETEEMKEEVISPKQSHNAHQTGRYEIRRTRFIGTYQIFDTSTGKYTNVKWKPLDERGEEVSADIESAVNTVIDKLRNALDKLEEKTRAEEKDSTAREDKENLLEAI